MSSIPPHAIWTQDAQDVFQIHMDRITDRLPGIIVILDDICIYGKNREEHDLHLLQLMKTVSQKV